MRAAVVGVGSIGARHAANLRALGVDVVSVDPHLESDYPALGLVPGRLDAAVIATPADSHIRLAVEALNRGCHVFIEKPLAPSVAELRPLQAWLHEPAPRSQRVQTVQVGYNMRFRPELVALCERMRVDRPLTARIEFAQRLTEWRPGRDYRDTPTAQPHAFGGGILLEASHELDLLLWMFGPWPSLYGSARRLSNLAQTLDHVNALVDYGDLLVDVSLDMIASGYRRSIRAVHVDGEISEWSYSDDAGASYVAEMSSFLHSIETQTPPVVGLNEGYWTLQLVDAIVASSEYGRIVRNADVRFRDPLYDRELVAN